MKSFYTLIKIRTNQLSGDSLTIGVIVFNEFNYQVEFSKNKITVAKSLLKIDSKFIDLIIKEIKQKLSNHNADAISYSGSLLTVENILTSDYFEYMSRYSNGLIEFTSPKFIAINDFTKDLQKIYHLFVDAEDISLDNALDKKVVEEKFQKRIKVNLIDKVEDKVHTNIRLGNNMVPTLFTSFELDCIGKNGVLIGAKSLSFNQSKETIQKNLNTYISIIAHLSKRYEKSLDGNQFFLIADEPNKDSEEYHLWNSIRKNENLIQIKTSEESSSIAELILSKRATTFIEE